MAKKRKDFDEASLRQEADSVLQDYEAILGKKVAMDLHMFFNPHRIPVGLTDEEASICVTLYPLRKAYVARHAPKPPEGFTDQLLHDTKNPEFLEYMRKVSQPPPSLPRELRVMKKMTRARFKRGILAFLVQISEA